MSILFLAYINHTCAIILLNKKHRTHGFNPDYNTHMDAFRELGYGGAVTNVP